MEKFDYELVKCDVSYIESLISSRSAEGWELVSVVAVTINDRELYFKKIKNGYIYGTNCDNNTTTTLCDIGA